MSEVPSEVREAMARAVAVAYIPAYSDDAIWAEDLPNLLRRRARSSGPSHDNPFAVIDAALSALTAAGWVCAPMELTEAMRSAFYSAKENGITVGGQFGLHSESAAIAWRAMLTASQEQKP